MKHDPPTDTMIQLSLSEIAALCARAIRGAGRSWGEAEEGAEAACWLARAGLDWASALLDVLDLPASDPGCPLRAGITLADCATLLEGVLQTGPQRLNVICPVFLLPFAARVADQTGQGLSLNWVQTRAVIAPGAAPWLEGVRHITAQSEVTITPVAPDSALSPDWPQAHRGAVSAAQYARLMDFLMAFTVPSSASSKAGAGAQEDDND